VSSDLREHLERALSSTYSLERQLGAGGMSLVFVAEERALGRRVVVKVLKPELSQTLSAERFRREMQFVARLQHPHIVQILHAGQANGVLYFTMPYVEGESLRECLQRSGELPIPRVAQILHDVCGALAYAHRRGVVHRDIKPENILFSDSHAVVTDFGIAKAIVAARTDEPATLSTLTELGTTLGTAAYMAPEQAAADPSVDHRADLYALGVVAYELLVGRPPFDERTQQALMAAHAVQEPEHVCRRRRSTPVELGDLVMQCLEKRPADRPQSADDVLQVLDGVVKTPPAFRTLGVSRHRQLLKRISASKYPWTVAATAVVVAIGAIVGFAMRRSSDTVANTGVRRFELVLPDSAPLVFVGAAGLGIGRNALALSPDGSTLAYVARVGSTTMLYLRDLSTGITRWVQESEGAFQPFFSPDSRWIAFFARTELKKVAVSEGRALSLAQVSEPYGGAWGEDGRIYVLERQGNRVSWIPESGGSPQQPLDMPNLSSTPQYLNGGWLLSALHTYRIIALTQLATGKHFIVGRDRLIHADSAGGLVTSGPRAVLRGLSPRYVRSGHLIFSLSGEDGVLMGLPFDASRRRTLGAPAPVLEGVRHEAENGIAQWSVADDGTLAYAPGKNAELEYLVWRDRAGRVDTLPFPRADYGEIRLSPDGQFLLAQVWPAGAPTEFWLLDLVRGTHSKLAGLPPESWPESWWPEGNSFVLLTQGATANDRVSLRWSPTTGELDTLVMGKWIWEVSPDTRWFTTHPDPGRFVEQFMSSAPGSAPRAAGGFFFSFSPDGRWVALTSNASGQSEVYVAPLPSLAPREKISTAGGEEAIWSRRGDEIVYRSGRRWFSVKIALTGKLSYSRPQFLFEGPFNNVPGWSHALSLDGQRHLLIMGPPEQTATRVNIVTNWFSELRRLAPAR
jgi:serine/threonine protein kinase